MGYAGSVGHTRTIFRCDPNRADIVTEAADMTQTEHVDRAFAAFDREQAPAVFALALRHSGDSAMARSCVNTVFGQLSDHWGRVRDPVRFSRRAAVLYVHGSHRRGTRRLAGCKPV